MISFGILTSIVGMDLGALWDLSDFANILIAYCNIPLLYIGFKYVKKAQIHYEKEDGSRPAEEFILSQDNKMKAKIMAMLDFLAEKGPALREPYSKHLEDGIFEVRAKQGSDISRVLYFFIVGKRVILTNGFVKKTQKTPPSEIKKSKRYREDYLHREER